MYEACLPLGVAVSYLKHACIDDVQALQLPIRKPVTCHFGNIGMHTQTPVHACSMKPPAQCWQCQQHACRGLGRLAALHVVHCGADVHNMAIGTHRCFKLGLKQALAIVPGGHAKINASTMLWLLSAIAVFLLVFITQRHTMT